ncbi:MAG TPA: glycosyltransferase 87 family protein [Gemmataceae bacterium]|nr:glycosyltransferase 87 family protein [Gemmataceae bacterium]
MNQRAVTAWAISVAIVAIVVSFPRMSGKLYPTFLAAGEHFRNGEPVYGWFPETQDQYRYSPLVAASFAPWSCLPTPVGAVLWRALQALLLLLSLRAWSRVTVPQVPWSTLAILSLPLVLGNVYNAQLNPLVLALILGGLAAFASGHFNLAAAAIAGAAIFKVYPLAIGLLLCTIEPRRFTVRLLVAVAIGMALPFAFHSPNYVAQQYSDWFARMGVDDRTHLSVHEGYQDFQRLLHAWGVSMELSSYRLMEVLVGGAMAGWLLLGRRSQSRRGVNIQLVSGLGLVWCTLFGPASESATYMLLAPVAAQSCGIAARGGWLERGWVYAAYALLLSIPIVMWFPSEVSLPYRTLVPQAHGSLMLLAWIIWRHGSGWWRRPTLGTNQLVVRTLAKTVRRARV